MQLVHRPSAHAHLPALLCGDAADLCVPPMCVPLLRGGGLPHQLETPAAPLLALLTKLHTTPAQANKEVSFDEEYHPTLPRPAQNLPPPDPPRPTLPRWQTLVIYLVSFCPDR